MLRTVSFGFLTVSFFVTAFGQQYSSAPSREQSTAQHDKIAFSRIIESSPYEQIAPYWTAEPGWHTDLQLRNNESVGNLIVVPTLRTANGEKVELRSIVLLPGEVRSVSLMNALEEIGSDLVGRDDAYGSIFLRYKSKTWRNLFASVMVHRTGNSIMYHLDASHEAKSWKTGSREGIWWLPKKNVKDYLILTNQARHPIEGTLILTDANGQEWAEHIQLKESQILRLSVRDLLSKAGLGGEFGGIQIMMSADAGSLDTVHILYDDLTGFSATMKMFDHNPAVTRYGMDFARNGKWTTRAPMLALMHPDIALAFPSNTHLRPLVFVRNTTTQTIDIVPEVHWRDSSSEGRVLLKLLHLAPHTTRQIDIGSLQTQEVIPITATWAQVTLSADTEPDSFTAVAASYDSTLRYGTQTPFSDQMASHLEGGEWKVDATHTSIIAIGNGGDQPMLTLLTLMYDQGRKAYQLREMIAANDQWMVDFGQLIRSQRPDIHGGTLPANLSSGAYSLKALTESDHAFLYEGKVITDKTYGHATYGCMTCCGVAAFDGPDPFLLANPSLFAVGQYEWVDEYGTDACSGDVVNIDNFFSSWGSMNTNIITSNAVSEYTGVAIGSTTLVSQALHLTTGDGDTYRQCPNEIRTVDGDGNVAQVSCTSVTRGASTTCTGTGPSGTTFDTWQFSDGNGGLANSSSGSTSNSWTGVAVTSGSISVTANFPDGSSQIVSGSLTVNPRSGWSFSSQPAVQVATINQCTAPSIPNPPTSGSIDGASCAYVNVDTSTGAGLMINSGPNTGYGYLSFEPSDVGSYTWTIAPDIQNSQTTFYQAQCGNYNASSNPSGFISGGALNADTVRHESGTVTSHYANYVNALSMNSYNLGYQIESLVAQPGQALSQLLDNEIMTVQSAVTSYGGEPCGTHNTNLTALAFLMETRIITPMSLVTELR